jgi:hypothetical protein
VSLTIAIQLAELTLERLSGASGHERFLRRQDEAVCYGSTGHAAAVPASCLFSKL